MKLVFTVPGPEAPGYLRRMRAALDLREKIDVSNPKPETVDALIDFLLPYIEEPEDRAAARDALLDASLEQYNELLSAITGANSPNPT